MVRNSIINMELSAENSERMELFISDVTGLVMLHQLLSEQAGINNVLINASALASGIYWLYGLEKEGKTNVVLFVKQC